MAKEITVCLPEQLWWRLNKVIQEEHATCDEVFVRLVEDHLRRKRYGLKEIEQSRPKRSINDIRLKDPEGIAQTLISQYGTEDAVEIVMRMRR